jgi:hypothetical protein
MAELTRRRSIAAAALAVLAIGVGLVVALLIGAPEAGVTFALGAFLGGVTVALVAPALVGVREAAGVTDDADAGWAEFHRELARGRRLDQPFAIARFDLPAGSDAALIDGLLGGIAAAVRRIDRAWLDDGHVLLLLPGAARATANAALARIRAEVPMAADLTPGMAVFPEDGVTSAALVSAAYGSGPIELPTPLGARRPDRSPIAAALAPEIVAMAEDDVAARGG